MLPAQVDVAAGSPIVIRRAGNDMRRIAFVNVGFRKVGVSAGIEIGAHAEAFLMPVVIVNSIGVIFVTPLEASTEYAIFDIVRRG